jgi:hypothetical protein
LDVVCLCEEREKEEDEKELENSVRDELRLCPCSFHLSLHEKEVQATVCVVSEKKYFEIFQS